MSAIENGIINLLLRFTTVDAINSFLSDPRNVAVLIGALVACSCAWLGTYLLLRKMSLTSDAISHTVLLGIVVAFLFMVGVLGLQPDLSSPLLILGAALAGVGTVALTEIIYRSGLVKADAALGLVFPFLFAISVVLISRYADQIHLDQDSVLVGEIGIAWANTNSYCYANCDDVTITPDHPRAEMGQRCINCVELGINPRDPAAVFESFCSNCGTYTAAQAWRERLITEPPSLVFWPKALTTIALITLINFIFITLLYKELKLASFDSGLAGSLGFRPGFIQHLLMGLVSVTAVGAFDAVGSVLVVAFFIIPAATAYLLTDRLWVMLVIGPLLGIASAISGYELARGYFLGIVEMNQILAFIDQHLFSLGGYVTWNTSISAAMVLMTFFFFLVAWILSPRYGLVSTLAHRISQRHQFASQLLLGHIYHHQGGSKAKQELNVNTLHEHLNWNHRRLLRLLTEARLRHWVRIEGDMVSLTPRGEARVRAFMHDNLVADKSARP